MDPPLALSHHWVAKHADARDLDLHHVTVLDVLGGVVRAHPEHVARMEGEILAHAADELAYPEDRVLDGVGEHLPAVDPDVDAEHVGIKAGNDPRAHGLEGIRVLSSPEGPVVALPDTLAHVVADGVAEDAVERVGLRNTLASLADHHHQLAFVLDLLRR